MMEKNGRLWQLDFLKGIACLFVVMLHFPFDGILGKGIIYTCRFSVPLFFMISGYFCYGKTPEQIVRNIKKLFFIILKTELFYGAVIYGFGLLVGKTISEITETIYAFRNPIGRLFYGSFFNGFAWYLYAILWTYIGFYFLKKANLLDHCFFLIPILLCVQVVGCYSLTIRYGLNRYIHLFRNPVTFGFPITLSGYWIAKNQEKLLRLFSTKKSFSMIVIGGCMMAAELLLFHEYLDYHFSTAVISTGMFLFALAYRKEPSRIARFISFIGQKLSLDIYLGHLFWGTYFGFNLFGLRPLYVIFLSGSWAYLMMLIREKRFRDRTSFFTTISGKSP